MEMRKRKLEVTNKESENSGKMLKFTVREA